MKLWTKFKVQQCFNQELQSLKKFTQATINFKRKCGTLNTVQHLSAGKLLTYLRASEGSLHWEKVKVLRARVEVKYCLKDGNISRLFLLPKLLRDRIRWAKLLVQPRNNAPKSWKPGRSTLHYNIFTQYLTQCIRQESCSLFTMQRLQPFIYYKGWD